MAITSVGTGSGLDLEDLITKIVESERAPAEARLDLKTTRIDASISALGSLKSSLADFQSSLAKLKATTTLGSRIAVSTADTLFTATSTSSADPSNYTPEVLHQANANTL